MTVPLTEEDLHELYLWVDSIPLSRPKRNITRDFSDGCCVAEVVKFFFPRLVDLHNYTPAMSMRQKRDNWDTLNHHVFRKLHFEVPQEEINDITAGVPGAIERFLRALRTKISQIKARREEMDKVETRHYGNSSTTAVGARVGKGQAEKSQRRSGSSAGASPIEYRPSSNANQALEARPQHSGAGNAAISSFQLLLDEKDRTIFELRETVNLLSEKVTKLEELVRVKDEKLNAYRAKLGRL